MYSRVDNVLSHVQDESVIGRRRMANNTTVAFGGCRLAFIVHPKGLISAIIAIAGAAIKQILLQGRCVGNRGERKGNNG